MRHHKTLTTLAVTGLLALVGLAAVAVHHHAHKDTGD